MKEKNGITLIALVITVIILLILAGAAVSIGLNGDNVFKKASHAVKENNFAKEKEEIVLASYIIKAGNKKVSVGSLSRELKAEENDIDISKAQNENGNAGFKIKYNKNGDVLFLNSNGSIEAVEEEELLPAQVEAVYAYLYKYNTGVNSGKDLLVLSSKADYTESVETGITLTQSYGNINESGIEYRYDYTYNEWEDENGYDVYEYTENGTMPPWIILNEEIEVDDEYKWKETYTTFGNKDIIKVKIADEIKPENTSYWFYWIENLKTIEGLEKIDTSEVTTMKEMFASCKKLEQANSISFDTSNVTDMESMFFNCNALTSLDLSSFDTSNVTNMNSMFDQCYKLTQVDVSSFNTSNVTDMRMMFQYCEKLTSLDLSKFDTSKITSTRSMFSRCMELTQLDISSFKTENVTDMGWMFDYCINLQTIYAGSGWNTENVTDSDRMFGSCNQLKGGNGTAFSNSHIDKLYARIDAAGTPGYFSTK